MSLEPKESHKEKFRKCLMHLKVRSLGTIGSLMSSGASTPSRERSEARGDSYGEEIEQWGETDLQRQEILMDILSQAGMLDGHYTVSSTYQERKNNTRSKISPVL